MTGPDISSIKFDAIYTEAPISPPLYESCNQIGIALKEHDYIGLSEVSFSSSSPGRQAEKSRREVFNLNLSATELRLGPPEALESSRNAKEDGEESCSQVDDDAKDTGCYQSPDQALDKETEVTDPQESNSREKFSEGALYVRHQEQDHIREVCKVVGVSTEGTEAAGVGTTEVSSPLVPASLHCKIEAERSPAHDLLRGLQQSSILQEFRKVQAMKAAADAQHARVMIAAAEENLRPVKSPLPQVPQDFENGHNNEVPIDCHAYPISVVIFPGAKKNGVKRAFTEAMGSSREGQVGLTSNLAGSGNEGSDVKAISQSWNCAPPASMLSFNPNSWHSMGLEKSNGSFGPFPTQQRGHILNTRQGELQDAGSPNAGSAEVSKHVANDAQVPSRKEPVAAASSPQQTVGWPPVRSFRKNQDPPMPPPLPLAPGSTSLSVQGQVNSLPATSNSWFMKIYMDGIPIGRKVDLKTNNSYEKLYSALEEMFHRFLNGQVCVSQSSTVGESEMLASSRKLKFLHRSEYVLIYEDQEGDFMLVGDVPWQMLKGPILAIPKMFISTVKRLRIMKGSEAVNLAPRGGDKSNVHTAVA